MRKALIPALFVLSGLLGSTLWNSVLSPPGVSQAEITGAIAQPMLKRVVQELLKRE
jgi:hypothetical protein